LVKKTCYTAEKIDQFVQELENGVSSFKEYIRIAWSDMFQARMKLMKENWSLGVGFRTISSVSDEWQCYDVFYLACL